ncbi:MAG: hypothetical protein ACLS69_03905 [Butyricicoccus sp.]
MIELMKQLCALPGPSGCEDAVREFVLEKVKPFADEMKTDAIGNIMVFRKGKKALERPVVLCAHMDEVGVIIKKIRRRHAEIWICRRRGPARGHRPTGAFWRCAGRDRHQGGSSDNCRRAPHYAQD